MVLLSVIFLPVQWRLCEIGLEDYSFVLLSRYPLSVLQLFVLLTNIAMGLRNMFTLLWPCLWCRWFNNSVGN